MTDLIQNENGEIDFKAELEKALGEEESDAAKYMNLAEHMKAEHPGSGYASILKDIALEEMTHHKHIREILHDMKKKETMEKWT